MSPDPVFLSVLLLFGAGTAVADPVVERVAWRTAKGRRLEVTVETRNARPGVVALEGTAGGRRVRMHRRVRAGTRSSRIKVDAKRLRMRNLDAPLVFDLELGVSERGSDVRDERTIRTTIPVPLVVLPGFGNETTPGVFDAFAAAIDLGAGGVYATGTPDASAVAFGYDSTADSLATSSQALDARVKALLRGTVFGRVDVVGYSMGGLVARRWLADEDADRPSRARKVVFLCTPNEGAPVAYVAVTAAKSGQLATLLGGAGFPVDLGPLLDGILTPQTQEALRVFYPTFGWATVEFLGRPVVLPPGSPFLPDSASPLADLNAVPPHAGVDFHAVLYTSFVPEVSGLTLGTVDQVDLTSFLADGTFDPAALATGEGDGVVPAHSVTMDGTPAWKAVLTPHDLGSGFHITAPADPRAIAEIVTILTGPQD